MLNSIFETSTTNTIEISSLLIASLTSIILGILIAITHKFTSKYSKNFLITVTILPLLVQSVMIMVNGNLGTSIAIMGAFSLVRFRSMPGTSKEILIVFFAMSVGLATGMGQILFAIIVTILGCTLLLLLNNLKLFEKNKNEKELTIVIPENLDYTEVFDDIFEKYTQKIDLVKVKTTNMGSMFELSYKVILNNKVKEKEFIDDLRTRNGNLKISLSHALEEMDL